MRICGECGVDIPNANLTECPYCGSMLAPEKTSAELFALGMDYYFGRNNKTRNIKKACEYFGRVETSGCDDETGTTLNLILRAEQGDADAQNILGVRFQNGSFGFPRNLPLAAEWYRKSHEQGFSYGTCNLGRCYLDGTGVERNEETGVRYLRTAAEKGNRDAKAQLIRMGL